ncbi:unnamed protein product [Oppiella nova]|uniref:glucan 1,3-beta-glucosidase n=1 Tax=Oppiella nova TaxID=334625 RepID=A0A7R9M837_9ACAR|nr:unnamed protein product [Oppiella nova]CAG2172385.1 unnamed protein product [Oppiella nova]
MLIGEWSACNHFNNPGRNGDFTKAEVNVYNQASLGWTFWSWTGGQSATAPISAQSQCEKDRLANVKSGKTKVVGPNIGSWLVLEAWMAGNVWDSNGVPPVHSKTKVRGSNLGSWLVMESWMAPQPWDENDCNKGTQGGSYLLEKCLGNIAPAVLQKHWSTFITENDFAEMSKHGVNVVRVPIGWWQIYLYLNIYDPQGGASKAKLNYHITPTDYHVGGLAYIDKAFEWGQKYGIGILLGMHAAPGSQNGNDHSSPAEHPGQINWDKYPANIGQTVESMELYAQRYAEKEALFGFCLLNEPAHIDIGKLQDYYNRAYAAVRKHSADSHIVLNPLITPFESGTESHWTGFMNPDQGFTKVAMDLHYYSCFGGGADQTNPDGAIGYINWDRKNQIADYHAKNPKQMLIGEWSACNHFNNPGRNGDFTKAEVNVYNQASLGWTFWSWTGGQSATAPCFI